MFNKTKQCRYCSNLEKVNTNDWHKNTSDTEKYEIHIFRSFAYKLVCTYDKVSKSVVLYRGPNATHKLIAANLEEYDCCKKMIKEYFNKNLMISVKDEEKLQSSNKCWNAINYLPKKIKR